MQSGKNLSATASGDSTLSIADMPETLTDAKKQAWKFTQIDQSDTERPDLKAYVITNTDCKVLVCLCSMVLRPVERLVFSPKER